MKLFKITTNKQTNFWAIHFICYENMHGLTRALFFIMRSNSFSKNRLFIGGLYSLFGELCFNLK